MNFQKLIEVQRMLLGEDALRFLQERTVQLFWVKDNDCKVDASGCLISFANRQYVMTVLHGVSEEIALLGRNVKTGEKGLWPIGRYPIVANTRITRCPDRGDPVVDFTFFPVADDICPIRQYALSDYSQEGEFDIVKLPVLPIIGLDKGDEFFYGGGLPIPGDCLDRYQFRTINGLHFDRCESDYLYFDVPRELSKERPDLSGMSGAPIFDGNGIPVGLVCGGCDENERFQIWGICMNKAVQIMGDVLTQKMPSLNDVPVVFKDKITALVKKSYFASDV